jgi:hypothetical protein
VPRLPTVAQPVALAGSAGTGLSRADYGDVRVLDGHRGEGG